MAVGCIKFCFGNAHHIDASISDLLTHFIKFSSQGIKLHSIDINKVKARGSGWFLQWHLVSNRCISIKGLLRTLIRPVI
jgi:hypothetical protein